MINNKVFVLNEMAIIIVSVHMLNLSSNLLLKYLSFTQPFIYSFIFETVFI